MNVTELPDSQTLQDIIPNAPVVVADAIIDACRIVNINADRSEANQCILNLMAVVVYLWYYGGEVDTTIVGNPQTP